MGTPALGGMMLGKSGVMVRATFRVLNGANVPVTGLLNGAFTKVLSKDGANSGLVVTVTELDAINLPGLYSATFTPASAGHYGLVVTEAVNIPAGVGWEVDVWGNSVDDLQNYECRGAATYDPGTDSLHVTSFVLKGGRMVTTPTSVTVKIYADSAVALFTLVSAAADANGVFRQTKASPALVAGITHSAEMEVVVPGVSVNPKTIVPIIYQEVA